MPPSRRSVLGTSSFAVAATLSGCLGFDVTQSTETGGTGPTETDSTDPTETATARPGDRGPFEARLDGPDGAQTLFAQSDVASVGPISDRRGRYTVPVVLTDDGAAGVAETLRSAGALADPDAFEVVLTLGGDEVSRFGVAPGFVDAVESGEWHGEFLLVTRDRADATAVRRTLRTGDGD
jgi:hypothetical protein